MSDDKISSNEAIDAALHLDGDPDNVKQFYADWARSYNLDVVDSEYTGPAIAAQLLQQQSRDSELHILDAGCGTGLVGVELEKLGYGHIDGFDLSPEMADLARATGAYDQMAGNVDIMKATEEYPQADYDALLCVGVFTLGHVPPEALPILLQLVRDDGLLVVSTRSQYYDQTDFQKCFDELLADGRIEELQVVWSAPYNHDGDAHYWVFKKRAA